MPYVWSIKLYLNVRPPLPGCQNHNCSQNNENSFSDADIDRSMAQYKAAVTPLLMHWSYCSFYLAIFALSGSC